MAPLVVTSATPGDAPEVAQIHIKAMDYNELLHAQFPSEVALNFLQRYLEKETVEFLQSDGKGVLVARDSESGEIAGFAKWIVHREGDDDAPADDVWPSFCRTEYLNPYADLTARVRKSVMGSAPYYHVTFLCANPRHGGKGAASSLLRRVQKMAAEDGKAVVLESTMSAVSFYERLGFEIAKSLDMMLPPRGSSDPTELYEERCMVWKPTADGASN